MRLWCSVSCSLMTASADDQGGDFQRSALSRCALSLRGGGCFTSAM